MLQRRQITAGVKTILLSGGGHRGPLCPPAYPRGSKAGLKGEGDKLVKSQDKKLNPRFECDKRKRVSFLA